MVFYTFLVFYNGLMMVFLEFCLVCSCFMEAWSRFDRIFIWIYEKGSVGSGELVFLVGPKGLLQGWNCYSKPVLFLGVFGCFH